MRGVYGVLNGGTRLWGEPLIPRLTAHWLHPARRCPDLVRTYSESLSYGDWRRQAEQEFTPAALLDSVLHSSGVGEDQDGSRRRSW